MCEIVDCEYPAAQLLCDECKGEEALNKGKNQKKIREIIAKYGLRFQIANWMMAIYHICQSELKSGEQSVILFLIFAITSHIIAVNGTNYPVISTITFYFKYEFLFHH